MRIIDGGYLSWIYGVSNRTFSAWSSAWGLYKDDVIMLDHEISFREIHFPRYKAHRRDRKRTEDQQHRYESVKWFRELMKEDPSLTTVKIPGLEADDLVTMTAFIPEIEKPIEVIGMDKDLLQLPDGPLVLRDVNLNIIDIERFSKRQPKFIQSYITSPLQVLLALALMGDSSDDVPRLVPARRLEVFVEILENAYPFQEAQRRFGKAFEQNLYLTVLPGPWVFKDILEPRDLPASIDHLEYWFRPFNQKIESQLRGGVLQSFDEYTNLVGEYKEAVHEA